MLLKCQSDKFHDNMVRYSLNLLLGNMIKQGLRPSCRDTWQHDHRSYRCVSMCIDNHWVFSNLSLSLSLVAVPLDFCPRESEPLPMGSPCFVCDLYSHSETAHEKSLWTHQKEQKNYPWRFPNQVVRFSRGLSNHKSSLTNRVEEKSKSGNRNAYWAHFVVLRWNCGIARAKFNTRGIKHG